MKPSPPTIPFVPLAELTISKVCEITGAPVPEGFEKRPIGAISTDTRTLKPGETFLALSGENFDGHAYARRAAESGAGALIVGPDFDASFNPTIPLIRVSDPLRAYGDLAAYQRRAWGGRVIALSGSVGKTTTRRLIAHALRNHVAILEPIRNFNNLIGVPKTLERLEPTHEVLIAELGMNQPGELDRLTEIVSPDVAGLTRLGPTHIGMFGSMESLVEAKAEIFRRSPDDTTLVANADCPWSVDIVKRYARDRDVVWFRGTGEADAAYRIENPMPLESGGYRFDLAWPEGRIEDAEIKAFGRHLLEDIAAAAAFLGSAGYDPAWVVESLDDFNTEPLRGQILLRNEKTFILDCYNAGLGAVLSALETLAELPRRSRTILVLADMLELGDFAAEFHDRLVDPIQRIQPALLCSLGEQFARIGKELNEAGIECVHFPDHNALIEALALRLEPGDLVFFKGSRRFELEKIAQALAGDIPGWDGAH